MNGALELWLVRHGETVANAGKRISGWTDVALSETGISQAENARKLLNDTHFDGVWSSDLERAIHTARIAYGEPSVDARLREMWFGELEDKPWETADPALTKALLAFEDFHPPGGENLEIFRDRLMEFVDALCPGRHLLFTHGGVIRMFTSDLGHDQFVKNTSIVRLDWTERRLLSIEEPE